MLKMAFTKTEHTSSPQGVPGYAFVSPVTDRPTRRQQPVGVTSGHSRYRHENNHPERARIHSYVCDEIINPFLNLHR